MGGMVSSEGCCSPGNGGIGGTGGIVGRGKGRGCDGGGMPMPTGGGPGGA